jgi:MoaA/NifB/PqqE/SkfB family radical SAM enzyme
MTTEGVYELLREGYESGMRGYYLFGGEPLIRKDIGQLVDYAKTLGFVTTMNTNASLLASKAMTLRGLDFAFVSVDYPNEYDDYIRGRKGSFEDAIRGIRRIREEGSTKVIIVTTISTLNLDAVEAMAKLARDLKVGISYNFVEPTLDFGLTDSNDSPNMSLGVTKEQLRGYYSKLLELKKEGYPLMETEYVLRHFAEGRPWTCHFPKMFVYVSPDKKIFDCTYGYSYDLRKGSFEDYFSSSAYKEQVHEAETCNRCVRTCVRGYSYAYDFNPLNFIDLIGDARMLFDRRAK